jgi:hypothetical protein
MVFGAAELAITLVLVVIAGVALAWPTSREAVFKEPVGAVGAFVAVLGFAFGGMTACRQTAADLELEANVARGQHGDNLVVQAALNNDGLAGVAIKSATLSYVPHDGRTVKRIEALGYVGETGIRGIGPPVRIKGNAFPLALNGRTARSVGLVFPMPECEMDGVSQPDLTCLVGPCKSGDTCPSSNIRLDLNVSPGGRERADVGVADPPRRSSSWKSSVVVDRRGRARALRLERLDSFDPEGVALVDLLVWSRRSWREPVRISRPVKGEGAMDFPVDPEWAGDVIWAFEVDGVTVTSGEAKLRTK